MEFFLSIWITLLTCTAYTGSRKLSAPKRIQNEYWFNIETILAYLFNLIYPVDSQWLLVTPKRVDILCFRCSFSAKSIKYLANTDINLVLEERKVSKNVAVDLERSTVVIVYYL